MIERVFAGHFLVGSRADKLRVPSEDAVKVLRTKKLFPTFYATILLWLEHDSDSWQQMPLVICIK